MPHAKYNEYEMLERSLCKNVAYLSVFNDLYIKTNIKPKYFDNTSKLICINKRFMVRFIQKI